MSRNNKRSLSLQELEHIVENLSGVSDYEFDDSDADPLYYTESSDSSGDSSVCEPQKKNGRNAKHIR